MLLIQVLVVLYFNWFSFEFFIAQHFEKKNHTVIYQMINSILASILMQKIINVFNNFNVKLQVHIFYSLDKYYQNQIGMNDKCDTIALFETLCLLEKLVE